MVLMYEITIFPHTTELKSYMKIEIKYFEAKNPERGCSNPLFLSLMFENF